MTPRITVGDRIPQAALGRLVNGEVQRVFLDDVLKDRRAVIVGVPGAFTPVCSCEHVPDLLANADRLRMAGMDEVICIAPNDPWTIEAWAERIDPSGKLLFLSDGNLSFARALGVTVVDYKNMLGERSARYMMIIGRGIVHRLSVEPQLTTLSCTRAQDVVFVD
jgi:2-Cys peroxiredoxin 5